MTDEGKLLISLAIIRISVGLFFLIWSFEKILKPEIAQAVFSRFYFLEISPAFSVAIGILQTLIVLAFLAGVFKLWSYGAVLGMHTVSVLSTYQQLFNPYQPPNHLFWAGVPTLGAIFALFILRNNDNLFTLNFTGIK
ncbi:MAG: DoxX protein [Cyanobacteriota bacterium]|nr:DoxX protein [Cyanobacteriota bacterium]